jgi:hypothetical protein
MVRMIAQTARTRNRGVLPHEIRASDRQGKFCRARYPLVAMKWGRRVNRLRI